MNAKTFTIIDPKNHNDHTLPMSDYLFDMLARRKAAAVNGYICAAAVLEDCIVIKTVMHHFQLEEAP